MNRNITPAGAHAARRRLLLTAPALLCLALLPGAARAQWAAPATDGSTNYPNGNVGVGTPSPQATLHVERSAPGGDAKIMVLNPSTDANSRSILLFGEAADGARYGYLGYFGANYTGWANSTALVNAGAGGLRLASFGGVGQSGGTITFTTAPSGNNGNESAAERMRIDPAGNVGIGTAAPSDRLHIENPFALASIRIAGKDAGAVNFVHKEANPNVRMYQWKSEGGFFRMGLVNDAGTYARKDILVADSDGNVGIGTEDPTQLLDISGAGEVKARAAGTTSAALQLQESSGAATWSEWQQIGDRLRLNTHDGATTRADVLTVLPDGKVGIGAAATAPTHTLEVAGTINATGAITGGSIQATYQDVAEWVPSVQKLSGGTVVILDAGRVNHVVASSSAYDTKVAGVVSEQPGVILGTGGEGKVKVATTGRVKVRVDASRGAIKVGDLLVTSGAEGVAMKSIPVDLGGTPIHRPGTIIGKALEPLASGTGEILVLLSLQ